MGLNLRGRRRGCGNKTDIQTKHQRMMDQDSVPLPSPPGMFFPHFKFSSGTPFGPPPFFQGSYDFNHGSSRSSTGKFPRKNFKKNFVPKKIDKSSSAIDLTKPWVTEEIRYNEIIKQEFLQIWKNTKADEDWNKFKKQKLNLQALYEKAKAEYAASHPNEVAVGENISTIKHYYCETCDKAFRTDDDLILHKSGHETCGRDGCEFTAHPKIIAKHVKMQHLTGLYKRIGKLYAEEDIAKWIEERKKRYPTRKVIEEKKILEQEKINRGERINSNESKFNDSFRNKKKNGGIKKNFEKKTYKTTKNRRMKRNKKTSVVQNFLEEEETSFTRKGVPAFLGINSGDEPEAVQKNDCDISDEEWETECFSPNIAKPLLNSSLKLLATYDSDEENQNEKLNDEAKVSDMLVDEGSGPEEVKSVICKNPLAEENSEKKTFSFKKKFSQKNNYQERRRQNYCESSVEERDFTLLEKLLKNEIRHERNVILQCIQYIVKNNFFKA